MTKMSFAQRIDVWRTLTARPASQQLHRFGLKPRRGRRPEKPVVGSVVPSSDIKEPPAGGE